MSIIGKLHEFSFYGLISTILCLINKWVSFDLLRNAATHIDGFRGLFLIYLFWACKGGASLHGENEVVSEIMCQTGFDSIFH